MDKEILKLLQILISRSTYDNSIDIDVSGEDYINDNGFFIVVGTAGTVHAITFGGQEINRQMDGPIPIRLKKIFSSGTSATDISANW